MFVKLVTAYFVSNYVDITLFRRRDKNIIDVVNVMSQLIGMCDAEKRFVDVMKKLS
jgi:predicted RNA-binding protein associated with RNAse of E/G family